MEKLNEYRSSIDNLDLAIFSMLAERFKVTQKVGEYKALHNIPATDEAREASQLQKIESLANQFDLDSEFCKKLLRFIIDEVVENHKQIAKETA